MKIRQRRCAADGAGRRHCKVGVITNTTGAAVRAATDAIHGSTIAKRYSGRGSGADAGSGATVLRKRDAARTGGERARHRGAVAYADLARRTGYIAVDSRILRERDRANAGDGTVHRGRIANADCAAAAGDIVIDHTVLADVDCPRGGADSAGNLRGIAYADRLGRSW